MHTVLVELIIILCHHSESPHRKHAVTNDRDHIRHDFVVLLHIRVYTNWKMPRECTSAHPEAWVVGTLALLILTRDVFIIFVLSKY